VDPIESVGMPWMPAASQQVLTQVTESCLMDRRGYLVLNGVSLADAVMCWSSRPPREVAVGLDGARIGSRAITCLESRIEELWYLDDLLGGGPCLEAGIADLRLASDLLQRASYPERIRQQLWRTTAGLARFTGWAAFDAGRNAVAQRLWHAALRAAHAADDISQVVYVLSNLALQEIYAGDGCTAIHMLESARSRTDPAMHTVEAMVDTWQARAHAELGERAQAATLLNRTDSTWDRRRPEDDPPWVYWMPQPSTTAEAGTALLAVGDLRHAEQPLAAGLAGLGADSARDRNLYLIRLAETRFAAGRLDDAVATSRLAIEALSGAGNVDSPRVDARIAAFVARLPSAEPAVGELRDYWRTRRATPRSAGLP
jgi:hypothetical protein